MAAARAKQIGGRMQERRLELDLTQTEVAERINGTSVNKDYISRWERGVVEPSEVYLDEIAEALETTVADLMAGPLAERKSHAGPTPDLFNAPKDDSSQLDRIERVLNELRAEQATTQDAVAALDALLTKELRAIAQKLDTSAKGSRKQTGG